MSLPWKYIKISELISSVTSDLALYDDSDLIDEDRVVKIIMECNEKLGQRIYKPRECKLNVIDYKANIPLDLYKIENLMAANIIDFKDISTPDFGATQVEFTYTKPKNTTRIITYGKVACTDSCNNCYWVEDRKPIQKNTGIIVHNLQPLKLSNNLYNKCTDYSPCSKTYGEYKIDIEDNLFKVPFREGDLYLCYLGNLIDEDGNVEIPFHPYLNPYYEYAVKEKILEDIYLNSEADVLQKLQYISNKKREAHAAAWDFVNTREVNEWNKIQKKLQTEYYNKWYKIFN